jgi:tRNA dimethylallyltransferase
MINLLHFASMNLFSQAEIEQKVILFLQASPKGVIEITGPTASGKTGFSVFLAQWIEQKSGRKCEIISVDSRQIFRGCDISSAKITAKETAGIPHHGLDLADPTETYSVVQFQQYAFEKIKEIQERGNIALLCGGTMLWLDAVSENYIFTDDPDAKSTQRGTPLFPFLKIGMHWDREKLYERLNLRSTQMFEGGMIEEAEKILEQHISKSALTSFGYQEIATWKEGKITKEEALTLNQKRNRNYAKRQLTWWRGRDDILWIDAGNLQL